MHICALPEFAWRRIVGWLLPEAGDVRLTYAMRRLACVHQAFEELQELREFLEQAKAALGDGDEAMEAWTEVVQCLRQAPPIPQQFPFVRTLVDPSRAPCPTDWFLDFDPFVYTEFLDKVLRRVHRALGERDAVVPEAALQCAHGLETHVAGLQRRYLVLCAELYDTFRFGYTAVQSISAASPTAQAVTAQYLIEAKFCRIYTVLVPTLRPVDCTFVLLEGRLSSEYVLARSPLPGNYAVPMSMPYMGKTLRWLPGLFVFKTA